MEQVNSFLSQYKIPIALSLIGSVLIIGGIFSSGIGAKDSSPIKYSQESLFKPKEESQFKVDISGAVNAPGVYNLRANSRVEDAIREAQGFAQNVNKEFISKSLNLSQKVSDGQKIYIPFKGETGFVLSSQSSITSTSSNTGKIGINSATAAELDKLPGIGPATSAKIIAARPYNSVDDLLAKKAVSRSVFEKIKDQIDAN